MTTAEQLLAKKMQLLARLREEPNQHEREHIERRLAETDDALNALELEPRLPHRG